MLVTIFALLGVGRNRGQRAFVGFCEIALLEVGLKKLGLTEESGLDDFGLFKLFLCADGVIAGVKLVGECLRFFLCLGFSSVTLATVVLSESTFVPRSAICIFADARSLRRVDMVASWLAISAFRLSTVFLRVAL